MTLPVSGALSFNAINVELGVAGTTTANINQASYRTLAGVPSGTISLSNFYGKSNTPPFACATYTTVGSFTFTVPTGITSISVVCVAAGFRGCHSDDSPGGAKCGGYGGGLSYTNSIATTPGEALTVNIASNLSNIKRGATYLVQALQGSGNTGSGTGAVRYNAGLPTASISGGGGGGGAAGFAGTGGRGPTNPTAGSGAGGGGGNGGLAGGGGGGTGVVVLGATGTSRATNSGLGGTGGSSGASGGNGVCGSGGPGGAYGGGGGGAGANCDGGGCGGAGAVRIIYGGTGKSFPSNSAP